MRNWGLELMEAVPWYMWAIAFAALIGTGVLDFIRWRAERKRQEYREF
jgi:hypothetical protein